MDFYWGDLGVLVFGAALVVSRHVMGRIGASLYGRRLESELTPLLSGAVGVIGLFVMGWAAAALLGLVGSPSS
jgi:hypothetical protein